MKKNIRIKERRDDMKIEEGSVIKVHENGLAEVKVGRHSDCIACGAVSYTHLTLPTTPYV